MNSRKHHQSNPILVLCPPTLPARSSSFALICNHAVCTCLQCYFDRKCQATITTGLTFSSSPSLLPHIFQNVYCYGCILRIMCCCILCGWNPSWFQGTWPSFKRCDKIKHIPSVFSSSHPVVREGDRPAQSAAKRSQTAVHVSDLKKGIPLWALHRRIRMINWVIAVSKINYGQICSGFIWNYLFNLIGRTATPPVDHHHLFGMDAVNFLGQFSVGFLINLSACPIQADRHLYTESGK